jgi:hypothetical protein
MWKEAVMVYFKALSQHLPGRMKENHVKPHTGTSLQFSETLNMMQDANSLTATFVSINVI